MIIYPAIDILNGRCVRLKQGDLSKASDYGEPLEVAQRYRDEGAGYLHVVDLNGAFGTGDNSDLIARIVTEAGIPVQVGGGIRTKKRIETYLEKGISRVILGTVAIEFPELVIWAVRANPGRIAAGLDARNGDLAVRGWAQPTEQSVFTAARRLAEVGVRTIIYTDISKDGMMSGPDLEGTGRLVRDSGAEIIGSGGISTLEDVAAMRAAGASGLIIGRALLDGAFTLEEALKAAASC